METFNLVILTEEISQELDPSIKPLVEAVNRLGVVTIESSEGHLTKEKYPYPYVLIALFMSLSCSSEKIYEFVEKIIKGWNYYQTSGRQWIFVPNSEDSKHSPPTILCLRPRESNSQRDSQILRQLQKQASELASFLKEL